jgi:poly[(R)-3-hydroxyalkanoate] polymerase subunit PhaC
MTSADDVIRMQNGAATRRPAGPQRGASTKVRPGQAHPGPPGKAHPGPPPAGPAGDLADGAAHLAGGADAILGPSPFVGFGLRDAVGGLRVLADRVARQPRVLLHGLPRTAGELVRIGRGKSQLAPAKADKRFRDPAWSGNRLLRSYMQAYLHFGSEVDGFVDNLDLDGPNAERVRFLLGLAREALAPTNSLLTNPEALKRCIETGGGSLVKGARNLAGDLRHNHGMPSQVDLTPFKVGENLAVTPGAVIHRTEVFELIQYAPQAKQVHQRPLLVVPPQVNKYYALDLAPDRSMYQYALYRGFQVFGISWRNPTPAQREWGLDTYTKATLEAIDVVREVSGSPDVNLMGGCAGGMMVAILLSRLAALADDRVNAATLVVTLLDLDADAKMLLFATAPTLALARRASSRKGVLEGWQMAQIFAWLRPNDLVWNYWVNNYLAGRKPPAFDILAWNADTTRLPAKFHHQLLDIVSGNQLVHPGALEVLGMPVDMSRVTCDTYVAAGLTDHITPWQGCYQTTQLLSGDSRFVLCSSGHIQTVVADPGHPRLGYFVNPETPADPADWLADAQRHEGSWWADWATWLATRSGPKKPAAAAIGSEQFPPKEPAPGTYVFQ